MEEKDSTLICIVGPEGDEDIVGRLYSYLFAGRFKKYRAGRSRNSCSVSGQISTSSLPW
jgi:hypothetical protein